MKITTPCGRFWLEQDEETVALGLSPEFFTQTGVIWVFAPKQHRAVHEAVAFASIESSKFLGPLRSPITGKIDGWNDKALLTPETLTHEDWILKVKVNIQKEVEVK